MPWAKPYADDSGAQLHEALLPVVRELPNNRDSPITKSLYHKMCDKCQNPNTLRHAQRECLTYSGRSGRTSQKRKHLRGRELFWAEGMNLCKRTGEHLVGSPLKLKAEKTKGERKGEKGLHCVGRALSARPGKVHLILPWMNGSH